MPGKVLLVASGDLRPSANAMCWPAQAAMEQQLCDAVRACGGEIERAHPYDPAQQHGFIASQKQGMAIFAGLDADAPIIVAEAVWQYSHHVFAGLTSHRGPILTVANWSGQWPGLVGMLNLNGSLTKAGVPYHRHPERIGLCHRHGARLRRRHQGPGVPARARGRDRVPHRAAVGGGGRGVGRRDACSRRRQRPRRHPGGDGGHEPKWAHHHAGWGRSFAPITTLNTPCSTGCIGTSSITARSSEVRELRYRADR